MEAISGDSFAELRFLIKGVRHEVVAGGGFTDERNGSPLAPWWE